MTFQKAPSTQGDEAPSLALSIYVQMYISLSNFPSISFDPINQSRQSNFSRMERGQGEINAVYIATSSEH